MESATYVEGIPWVTFLDPEEEDEGDVYDSRDMAGKFTKVR